MVLDSGRKIASVFADIAIDQVRLLLPLLDLPSMEDLVIFVDSCRKPDKTISSHVQGEFPFLRRLSVSGVPVPIDKITTPCLVHLSLEGHSDAFRDITTLSILNLLQGSPQLETILLNFLQHQAPIKEPYTAVALPKLRTLELGLWEVSLRLVEPLRFPPTVAVGFRGISSLEDRWMDKTIRHILAAIDIQSITLAHIRHKRRKFDEGYIYLIRYGGLEGSLEIMTCEEAGMDDPISFTHPEGIFLSHSPQLDNVKTLHLMDCRLGKDDMAVLSSVMPSIVSIEFIGNDTSPRSLAFSKGSKPLFPCLKHIGGLPPVKKVVEMAKARKRGGVSLSALDVEDAPEHLEAQKYVAELERLVEDVKFWRCADLPECWTRNRLLDAWEEAGYRGPVSSWPC